MIVEAVNSKDTESIRNFLLRSLASISLFVPTNNNFFVLYNTTTTATQLPQAAWALEIEIFSTTVHENFFFNMTTSRENCISSSSSETAETSETAEIPHSVQCIAKRTKVLLQVTNKMEISLMCMYDLEI